MSALPLREIMAALEQIAPLAAAESWDNVGLLWGDDNAAVAQVLLCVDYTHAVAAEARALAAGLVVAYHPAIFSGLKRVPGQSLVFTSIRDGIALYSPHTALDVAAGGTNDVLADAVQMQAREPLRRAPEATLGLGRIGTRLCDRAEIIRGLGRALGLAHVLVSGPQTGAMKRIAVAAGSGGELLGDAMRQKADVFVTGELKHHDALKAAARGVTVIMTMHSNSERVALGALAGRLSHLAPGPSYTLSTADRDPFSVIPSTVAHAT